MSVLRILHLEDDPHDAEIVGQALVQGGIAADIVRVDNRHAFETEVRAGGYDVIFSDYRLPSYDGASALAFARQERPDVPFVLISGVVGEDAAIGSLLDGATDYVLKDRLSRLVPSVQRALREAENRRARRRAEEALQTSEQRYRRLFESSEDGILLLAPGSGRILDVNPAAVELLGFTAEQLLGRTAVEVGICGSDPATQAAFAELATRDNVRHAGVRLSTSAGKTVEVEFVASLYSVEGQAIVQLNVRDISERQRLEAELRQSQKLEAVGRLAGGVAHDFNNMLMVINSYTEDALRVLPFDHPLHADLQEVRKAGVRAARLTSQLLAFSRKQIMRLVVCSLGAVVSEIAPMLRRVVGEGVDLAVRLYHGRDQVLADPGQVEQVLFNLVANARDAIDKGGSIVVETGSKVLSPEDVENRADLVPGNYVTLSVSDTGCGMDEATTAHMFEPFFTTKAPGKGTGLGLSTVYGIVKQSGGQIEVESRVGKGTTVRIYLPLQEAGRADVAVTPPPGEVPAGRGETIVLVEDDPSVRHLVNRALVQAGYRVLVAGSGPEALSIVQAEDGSRIDLLLTDVILPGMNGCELARMLTASHPTLRVAFMSGYAAEVIQRFGMDDAQLTLIEKPFTITELLGQIRTLLSSRPPQGHS
jgi:two-component system cell cycle sensor histidine kinase/response regulator CckA